MFNGVRWLRGENQTLTENSGNFSSDVLFKLENCVLLSDFRYEVNDKSLATFLFTDLK